jgi:hypothetical protein
LRVLVTAAPIPQTFTERLASTFLHRSGEELAIRVRAQKDAAHDRRGAS